MLLRGQNLLSYRHHADDVVEKTNLLNAHKNGMDVFRIFWCDEWCNVTLKAVKERLTLAATLKVPVFATTSPVHNSDTWVDLAKRLEDLGCHSLCIKDGRQVY